MIYYSHCCIAPVSVVKQYEQREGKRRLHYVPEFYCTDCGQRIFYNQIKEKVIIATREAFRPQ